MLTALNAAADVQTAMGGRADDFLTKPLDRNQLAMRLAVAERLRGLQPRIAELQAR